MNVIKCTGKGDCAMIGKVICIANRKGGVGKTTTAHALLCGLTQRGFRVLAVDADGQQNLSFITEADGGNAPTLYEVLTGKSAVAEAIQHTKHGEVIPASVMLESITAGDIKGGAFDALKLAVEPLKADYDYIIIDTPPSAGLLTLNAMTAADVLIITARADATSARGLDQVGGLLDIVRGENPTIRVAGILLTCFNARANVRRVMKDYFSEAAAEIGTRVFDVTIREGVAVAESQLLHKSIFATRSKVAADYSAWIDELLEAMK